MRVPDLRGAAEKLVAAGTFHAVDAHVNATDADNIFDGEGARGIVFRGNVAMARIHRHGDRRAEINIAETEHEIVRIEHRFHHLLDAVEAIHAADEFDVARQPRRFRAHALDIFFDDRVDRRIVVRQRHPHDARRNFERLDGGQFAFGFHQNLDQLLRRNHAAIVIHLQGTHAG